MKCLGVPQVAAIQKYGLSSFIFKQCFEFWDSLPFQSVKSKALLSDHIHKPSLVLYPPTKYPKPEPLRTLAKTKKRPFQFKRISFGIVRLLVEKWQFCLVLFLKCLHSRYSLISIRVPSVEQELLTLPDHLNSPPVFSGVRVIRSLVLCLCFVDRCLSFFFWPFCYLSFHLRILITPLVSS